MLGSGPHKALVYTRESGTRGNHFQHTMCRLDSTPVSFIVLITYEAQVGLRPPAALRIPAVAMRGII